jgi:hypothetical protein
MKRSGEPRITRITLPVDTNVLVYAHREDSELHGVAKASTMRALRRSVCITVSELWSADPDFSAFPQLKVRNPLPWRVPFTVERNPASRAPSHN